MAGMGCRIFSQPWFVTASRSFSLYFRPEVCECVFGVRGCVCRRRTMTEGREGAGPALTRVALINTGPVPLDSEHAVSTAAGCWTPTQQTFAIFLTGPRPLFSLNTIVRPRTILCVCMCADKR